MCCTHYFCLYICRLLPLLLICGTAPAWSQPPATSEVNARPQSIAQGSYDAYTPSVHAKERAIHYGLQPRIIDELLHLFEARGMELLERQQQIDSLLSRYQMIPAGEKTDRKLSTSALNQLGIAQDSSLIDILQWAVFAQGDNSPTVFALGKAEIWYGISPEAFRGLYSIFLEQQGELLIQEGKLNEFQFQLGEQVRQYELLLEQLSERADNQANEAKLLLEQGRISEATDVLKNRYAFQQAQYQREQQETAQAAYDYAQALELNLKYPAATTLYRDAVTLVPNQTDYLSGLSYNLMILGYYEEAIPYIKKSIKIDSTRLGGVLHLRISIHYNNLAEAYKDKGEYDRAINYLNRSLDIRERLFKEPNPEIANVYHNIGGALYKKGEFERSIEYYRQAMQIHEQFYGEDHPEIAIELNNLGLSYASKGEYEQAITYYEQALEINRSQYGDIHPEIATNFNNLGETCRLLGEYDQAASYLEKALILSQTLFGENHPVVASTYNNLGNIYNAKGAHDKAIRYYRKALDIDKKFHGPNHPGVAIDYHNLGGAYTLKGNYIQAIKNYEQALAINQQVFKAGHPTIAKSHSNLGEVFNLKGEYDKSIEAYGQALTIFKEFHEDDHPEIGLTYNNLGAPYAAKGEYDRAVELYEEALSIFQHSFEDGHLDMAKTCNNLGEAYRAKGNYTDAINYYEQALPLFQRFLEAPHADIATVHNNLGLASAALGNLDKAIGHYEHAREMFLQLFPEGHPTLALVYNNIGEAFRTRGNYDEAIPQYEQSLSMSRDFYGDNHPNLAIAYNNLALTHYFQGNFVPAIDNFEQAVAILSRFLVPGHPNLLTMQQNLTRAYNDAGMVQYQEEEYEAGLGRFQQALQLGEQIKDSLFVVTCFNNIGTSFKHLGQLDSALLSIDRGIALAEFLEAELQANLEIIPDSIRQNPEFVAQISQLSQVPILLRLYFHRAGVLHQQDRTEEAARIFKRLKQEAEQRGDTAFIEEIEAEGY